MIEQLRREADGVLVVSAGDDLTGPTVPAPAKAARGQAILDAYRKLGVDVMAIGEQDRAAGIDLAGVPNGGLARRGGVVFGLLAVDADDPEPRLQAKSAALRRAGARFVVAALHGDPPKVRKLLTEGPTGIDAAVLGHAGWGIPWGVEKMGETWVVEAPWQGQRLARLDLHILDDKLEFQDLGKLATLESRLDEGRKTLEEIGRRQGQTPPEFYNQRRRATTEAILATRRELQAQKVDPARSWLEVKQTPIEPSFAEEPAVAAILRAHKAELPRLTALPPGPPLVAPQPPPPPPPGATAVVAPPPDGVKPLPPMRLGPGPRSLVAPPPPR